MSRIGRKPVPIVPGVEVKTAGQQISVKGPLGSLTREIPPTITVSVAGAQVDVKRESDQRQQRALHGLVRNEIQNMMHGVTVGFERILEISGVGYKAAMTGRTISFSLGRTNPVVFPMPEGIEAKVDKQTIVTLKGVNKALVGQTAADIRALKPPDVYKAKGIKYTGEVLIRKEGKTGK
jgi:large subunit ribosomal protein L6